MPKPTLPRPTDGELAILRVLWERAPATVREVNSVLNQGQETGYTTTLKLMQIMTEKGLVKRDEAQRSHVYTPALSEQQAQREFVGDLLERVFKGSAAKLAMQALSTRKASPEEVAQIRQLLDDMERRSK